MRKETGKILVRSLWKLARYKILAFSLPVALICHKPCNLPPIQSICFLLQHPAEANSFTMKIEREHCSETSEQNYPARCNGLEQ